jgi:hypothetical protein
MTRHRRTSTILGTLTAAATLVALGAPPASATIVDSGPIQDQFPFTDNDFCGAGVSVVGDVTLSGKYRVTSRRPGDGLDYYLENLRVEQTITDQATGLSVYDIQPNTLSKDQTLTDNGDGTITIINLATGGERTYGHEGSLIARNSGQVRFRIVYDYVHDVEISRELIFGSTGTNDDFCEAVLSDWGYN